MFQRTRDALQPFEPDEKMLKQAHALGENIMRVDRELPELYGHAEKGAASAEKSRVVNEVARLRSLLTHSQYSSNAAVDAITKLRHEASADFEAESLDRKVLAPMRLSAANILEGRINRALNEQGETELSGAVKNARIIQARAHDVLTALQGNHVDAQKLGALLKAGRPLDGRLKTLATLARAFPKSFTPVLKSPMGSTHGWLHVGLLVDLAWQGPKALSHVLPIWGALEAAPRIAAGTAPKLARIGTTAPRAGVGIEGAKATSPVEPPEP